MMKTIPIQERGFTIIEIIITLAVFAIITTSIFGSMILQRKAASLQLEYAQAQENGRVALEVLKRQIRLSGWGFDAALAGAGNTVGVMPIGECNRTSPNETSCNNIDNGADRVRLRSMSPETFVLSPDNQHDAGSTRFCIGTAGGTLPPGFNGQMLVSGACGGAIKSEIIPITGTSTGCGVYAYSYGAGLTCTYDNGFNFGKAKEQDFFIDFGDPDHPKLMLDPDGSLDPTGSGSAAPMVVAYDIEDLQLEYGLDAQDPANSTTDPDGVVDIWCDNPNDVAGECNTTLTARENFARIIAVRVAVISRTSLARPELQHAGAQVQDGPNHGGDGFRRWIFRATISLRNVHAGV